MRTQTIETKLRKAVENYYTSVLGYDKEELDALNMFRVEFNNSTASGYTDINLYTELDYDDFQEIADDIDAIVEKYDPSAYFDLEGSGVITARIYWDTVTKTMGEGFDNSDLTKLGNSICLMLTDYVNEDSEDFWLDEIKFVSSKQVIEMSVYSDRYESEASIQVYAYQIESYKDLVKQCSEKLFNRLVKNMVES